MGTTFYSRNGDFIEITVRDHTGKRIDHFKCASANKKAYNKILSILRNKYNFVPEVKSFKKEDKDNLLEQETDFLDMSNNWFS